MVIKLTRHADGKMKLRDIKMDDLKCVVDEPLFIEFDRFDNTLTHFIGCINAKYLRVIGRKDPDDTFLVVSVFYDRRLKNKGGPG
jgi:hypothetical protein